MTEQTAQSTFRVCFGTAPASPGALHIPIPLLAGRADEQILSDLQELLPREGFRLFEGDGLLMGTIDEPVQGDLSAQTHDLYRRLLRLVADRQLVRIWNYVPRINQANAEGLENYRAFCRGRSLAFEEVKGEAYRKHLPAASAVGGVDDRLVVVFIATRACPQHLENPAQVPAYEYPAEHGPRPPSFARATRVAEDGRRLVFFSGTAAIKGHATIATGDLPGQIACLLDNLDSLSRACGLARRLGEGDNWTRHFKIYLRHADDYETASRLLQGELYGPGDQVIWLRSDICRAALLIEVEATLVARA